MLETTTDNQEVTAEHLTNRIQDWQDRLSNLYSEIEEWVEQEEGYRMRRLTNVKMFEELMQRFSLQPVKLPSLDILKGDDLVVTFRPVGLWIVGANGRVDMLFKSGSIILVDRSEQFGPSQWVAYSPKNKKKGEPFTHETFQRLLRNEE